MQVSPLLQSTRLSSLSQGTSLLVIGDVKSRSKSTATTKSIAKHIRWLLICFFELRVETNVSHTGERSVLLLRDYRESPVEGGSTAPSTGKHALTAWAEALGIDWATGHGLVTSAVTVGDNEEVKQAPAMSLAVVRKLEELSPEKESPIYKRALASAILVMTYAIHRFPDSQKIRTSECNADSVQGSLSSSKTKRNHGLNWPWACPRKGIAGASEWAHPLVDIGAAYRKINCADTPYLSSSIGLYMGASSGRFGAL